MKFLKCTLCLLVLVFMSSVSLADEDPVDQSSSTYSVSSGQGSVTLPTSISGVHTCVGKLQVTYLSTGAMLKGDLANYNASYTNCVIGRYTTGMAFGTSRDINFNSSNGWRIRCFAQIGSGTGTYWLTVAKGVGIE